MTQLVRLIDVFILGPLMVKASRHLSGPERQLLLVSGVLTIVFNGLNWLRIQRGETPLP